MFQNMGPAPTGRSGHAMAAFGKQVLVLGGESNAAFAQSRVDDPSVIHVLDTGASSGTAFSLGGGTDASAS
jgi:hypothetical protein